MSATTVHLYGIGDLYKIPDYLALGAIVVVAPDRDTLRRWEDDIAAMTSPEAPAPTAGLIVDLQGHRARWNGLDLGLTPLEYRVFTVLASAPGKAFSFGELRRSGWGEDRALGIDIFAVRSVVQRLRSKLRAHQVPERISSVRGFGFRLDHIEDDEVDQAPDAGLSMVRA